MPIITHMQQNVSQKWKKKKKTDTERQRLVYKHNTTAAKIGYHHIQNHLNKFFIHTHSHTHARMHCIRTHFIIQYINNKLNITIKDRDGQTYTAVCLLCSVFVHLLTRYKFSNTQTRHANKQTNT